MTKILAALGVVLLTASMASAQCGCAAPAAVAYSPVSYAPAPVVVNYAPAAPVYSYTASYPAPYVASYPTYGYTTYYASPYVVARPVVAAPVVYPAPYAVYYGRPWLYVPGQPIRNALRATFR